MKLDLEQLILDICGVWWSDPVMHSMVWNALLTCRTTLHRCGYLVESTEYQDISFLLDLHSEIGKDQFA